MLTIHGMTTAAGKRSHDEIELRKSRKSATQLQLFRASLEMGTESVKEFGRGYLRVKVWIGKEVHVG